MTFATPWVLWGLFLIPLALFAYWLVQRRRIKYAARFTNLDLLANVVDASPGRRRHLPALFALAALAALIVAVARPQTSVAVPRDDATVIMTLDSSASMTATDVPPTRLDAAKSASKSFLDKLPDRFKVGLVSFSTLVSVLQQPTEDRDAVRSSLNGIQGDVGTAIGDAIVESVALAPKPDEDQQRAGKKPLVAILLLSDGANSVGREPLDVVDVAKKAGIPIYTIAFGTPNGTVEITNDLGVTQTYNVPPDPETLKRIAEETGGRFFEAPTESDLKAVYDEIGSQVSYEDEKRELTAAFAGAGAVFLLLGAGLSALWFGRIP
ncbi:MAG TPA: VWA domain-containing protein [Gaiellaceae bacterium]|nr:VWA domain-containing protein [Gaiellaceae bacterium]